MRVYIPFSDGSSVSFDGENFTIYRAPKDIEAVDRPDINDLSKAEIAWAKRWSDIVKALEGAYRRELNKTKEERHKRIYKPQ